MRALFAILITARIAAACSCSAFAHTPLCQRIDQVKVLFIGTAVETNDDHDGFIKGGLWYRFSVEETFKGLDANVREVIVDPASGTSCQEEFAIGQRYLISSYGSTLAAQQAAAMSMGYPAADGKPPKCATGNGWGECMASFHDEAQCIRFCKGQAGCAVNPSVWNKHCTQTGFSVPPAYCWGL